MEQKDYKLEIINELLRNENHVRGIAKNLNTNHMSIFRKIKKLERENVVDYKEEGKNKKYFLKKTSITIGNKIADIPIIYPTYTKIIANKNINLSG